MWRDADPTLLPSSGRCPDRFRVHRQSRPRCGGRSGRRHAAVRERRARARRVPAKASADRPHQPAAAARDTVRRLQRRTADAERRVLRALPLERPAALDRSRRLPAARDRQGRTPLDLSLDELRRVAIRSRSSRSISARATAAATSRRASTAASCRMARWETRAGPGSRSRRCSTRPACSAARVQVAFNGLDQPPLGDGRTSSRRWTSTTRATAR